MSTEVAIREMKTRLFSIPADVVSKSSDNEPNKITRERDRETAHKVLLLKAMILSDTQLTSGIF